MLPGIQQEILVWICNGGDYLPRWFLFANSSAISLTVLVLLGYASFELCLATSFPNAPRDPAGDSQLEPTSPADSPRVMVETTCPGGSCLPIPLLFP
jgi:hypothetical protein